MDEEPLDEGSYLDGLFLAFTGILLGGLLGIINSSFLMAIGATQFIFLAPLMIYLHKTGKRKTLIAVIAISSVVALLNATCWKLVTSIR